MQSFQILTNQKALTLAQNLPGKVYCPCTKLTQARGHTLLAVFFDALLSRQLRWVTDRAA